MHVVFDKRTDRQTDRQTEFSSLDRVCIPCSAVQTVCVTNQSKLHKCLELITPTCKYR